MDQRVKRPPGIAESLLRNILPERGKQELMGDHAEYYKEISSSRGRFIADLWYWMQIMNVIPRAMWESIKWSFVMIWNYLKIAIRNMAKRKLLTFINISGLMLGICCCILAVLYVMDELSYDRFHENQDTLFRVTKVSFDNADGSIRHRDPDMVPAMASELTEFFPEIKHQTLFAPSIGVVHYEEKIFQETIHLVNTPFFKMFSFPLLKGNPESALAMRNNIVLSRNCVEKYFGNEDPMGKTMHIIYGRESRDFIVTGISENTPTNSSIQFDFLIHISNLPTAYSRPELLQTYRGWWGMPIFVQLFENASVASVEQRFDPFTRQYFASNIERYRARGWSREGNPFSFYLQPLKDIYLDVGVYQGRGMDSIYILMGIALMVIIIACINFINLTLGLSSVRSMEIGIRKVVGAGKKQLACQFWGESLLITIVSLFGGMILTLLLLPTFNMLSGKALSVGALLNMKSLASIALLTIFTGCLAGSYPAFVMAGFRPIEIFKQRLMIGGNRNITKPLVVFQFILSVGLILTTMIMSDQLSFLVNKDLGYDKEGLIVVRTQESQYEDSNRIANAFRNRLAVHSEVKALTACNAPFGLARYPRSGNPEGIDCHYNMVDPHFVETLGFHVIEGRDFIQDAGTPGQEALVNRSFVDALGLDPASGILIDQEIIDALGIPDYLNQTQIIGVLEDFHFSVLSHEIFPAIFHLRPVLPYTRMLVRVSTGDIQGTLQHLEEAWKDVQPSKPFVYYFQDDALENLYQSQRRWSVIMRYVSILTVFIACLGILGLTANMINRRFKEIGIRKVLGAGTGRVMHLIMKDYAALVALANVIAWPLVFIIIQKVLQNYPYRIRIGIQYFLYSAIISMILALGTILFLVLKAARANPVDSLRYE